MNKKIAQLAYFVSRINRQHIQFAFLVLTLAAGLFSPQAPSDGGGGPT